jgi:protein crumbs
VDGIGQYKCECNPGFKGPICEIDIDECVEFKPCVHGTCVDGKNNYTCDCDMNYGGKNCSVELIGCNDTPCKNNGTCFSYLVGENEHKYNCSCQYGFQGDTCQKITTMSIEKQSLLTVLTNRVEGYDIQLRFKTTLPNGVLALGTLNTGTDNVSPYSYILELVGGKLNLHSSLLNRWEGVFIGSNLNNSTWHKVFVAINTSHLILSANEEQTIYPINSVEQTNFSSFPVTYLGGKIPNLGSYLRHLPHTPTSFVGCMEDVVINGKWVLPDEENSDIPLEKVEIGCPRKEQCTPNPCNSHGHCSDLWHTFKCTCERPFLGKTCKYNMTVATFRHENTTKSDVIVNVDDYARRAIKSSLNISMFIRTRQKTGQIFYLGSDPTIITDPKEQSSIQATLLNGELYVGFLFNGTPEAYTVGGKKLDDGLNHLIEVVRNSTLVQVKLNGTEYFRKTLSTTGHLNAQVLYLGSPANASLKDDDDKYFKGLIQDVQISNGTYTMIVELYPLEADEKLNLPPSLGDIRINRESVLRGIVSDDLCRDNPCLHNGECFNTWNDFGCTCERGYKGKQCQLIQFCELQNCPGNAICKNLDGGFDCITNVTFHGNELKPLVYYFHQNASQSSRKLSEMEKTIEIAFRSKSGGTLLYLEDEEYFFGVSAFHDQITIEWQISSDLPEVHRFYKEERKLDWNVVFIKVGDNKLEAGWKGWEESLDPQPQVSQSIDTSGFSHLFSGKFPIYLAGKGTKNLIAEGLDQGLSFKGCLGETRIGGLLLPCKLIQKFHTRLKKCLLIIGNWQK